MTNSLASSSSFELLSEHRELLDRLSALELDKDGTELPFSSRLARDNMWTREFALRICDEYRLFLFLASTSPRMVTPSVAVDEAWHLHLLYTISYWTDLCANTLGHALHHIPTEGGDEQRGHYMECD